jgi:hypothetical protein
MTDRGRLKAAQRFAADFCLDNEPEVGRIGSALGKREVRNWGFPVPLAAWSDFDPVGS